jgi:hypothetical protein
MIDIKELTREQAREAMDHWKSIADQAMSDASLLPKLGDYWQKKRETLQSRYYKVKERLDGRSDNYSIDVYMGLCLYELLRHDGFTMRMASDDGFWRYMSLKVVPDLVADRWGKDAEDHYWAKPSRNWLRSLWWYVHLSWQGDLASTGDLLGNSRFSTDTILNLEERTGRSGTYIDVYRKIMYYYSIIPEDRLKSINETLHKSDKHATLFRTVMKLNTARSLTIDPSLYEGGTDGYVKSLFEETGVEF